MLKCDEIPKVKNSENIMNRFFGTEEKTVSINELDSKQNYLITGISGFVGSHLANILKSHGSVTGVLRDIVPSDWLNDALSGCNIVQGDVRDFNLMKRLVEHYNINTIFHIAANASVKEAINMPNVVFDNNITSTLSVLESIRNNPKFKIGNEGSVIFLNTDKAYGEKIDAIETDPYQYSEIYATSKACAGFSAKSYRQVYNLNIKTVHSCNIFGYDPFNNRLIPNVIKDCIKGRSPIIYSNDNSIREYVYIDDLINALYLVTSDAYDKDAYNVNTGYIFNQRDIVKKIIDYYNDINFESIKPIERSGNIPIQIQKQSLKSVNWNWKPSWSFEDAIAETVDLFMIYRNDWE